MNVNEDMGPDPMGPAASLRTRHLYRNARREPVVADPRPLNPGAPVIYARHRARRTPIIEHVLSAAGILLVFLFVGWLTLMVVTEEEAPIPSGNPPAVEVQPCTDYHAENRLICKGELLPPCPTEDSTDCYWDARAHGNGQGRSFYSINDQTVFLP